MLLHCTESTQNWIYPMRLRVHWAQLLESQGKRPREVQIPGQVNSSPSGSCATEINRWITWVCSARFLFSLLSSPSGITEGACTLINHSSRLVTTTSGCSFSGSSLSSLFATKSLFVIGLDLFELLDVFVEVSVLLEDDEELSLLGLSVLLSLHGDGLSSDVLEGGVVVSIKNTSGIG